MVLSSEIDRSARVVDGRVTWIRSWNSASRSTNDLAEALDFVVGQELDLCESIHSLFIDKDLRCGCAETNALKHGTHCVEGRHDFNFRVGRIVETKCGFWGFYDVPSH
jgi:hypothetical protein